MSQQFAVYELMKFVETIAKKINFNGKYKPKIELNKILRLVLGKMAEWKIEEPLLRTL